METIRQSIDVHVPISVAYNQWTQFEEFPSFMEGVEEVRQLDPTHLYWRVHFAGETKTWEARIMEQIPDHLIVWESQQEGCPSGRVTFEALNETTTRIKVEMHYASANVVEQMGEMFGVATERVAGDMRRFKEFIEQHQEAREGWRGTIQQGIEVNANL